MVYPIVYHILGEEILVILKKEALVVEVKFLEN